jgi:SAM-dependent methyltransferase
MPRIDNNIFYNASLNKHKDSASKVHWNSKRSQYLRFEVLISLLSKSLKEYTIIDAGCGLGELYQFLKDSNNLPKKYIGLDIHEKMVNLSKNSHNEEFYKCDILSDPLIEADFYICSGGMNILNRFETFTFIKRCFEHSNRGFVFNLLKGEDLSDTYNYFLPDDIKTLAKELNAKCEIVEDYMPLDFSVALWREN